MTVQLLIAFAASLLEDQNFVSLYMIHDGGLYVDTLHIGSADLDRTVVIGQKHLGEIEGRTLVSLEAVHEDFPALLHLELLSCNVYNCVHLLEL